MYYVIGASVSSLRRESTDSLIIRTASKRTQHEECLSSKTTVEEEESEPVYSRDGVSYRRGGRETSADAIGVGDRDCKLVLK